MQASDLSSGPFYTNIHSHRKPLVKDEICIRNGYLGRLATFHPGYLLSTGLHPWFTGQVSVEETESILRSNCTNPKVAAIGEIGLDKRSPNFSRQLIFFERQVTLAEELKKPIIIHCVKALNEVFSIVKNLKVPVILHGYSGSLTDTEKLLVFEHIYLSLGLINFKRGAKGIELVRAIPTERMFLETDNSNLLISEVYLKAAQVKEIPVSELQDITSETFFRLIPVNIVR